MHSPTTKKTHNQQSQSFKECSEAETQSDNPTSFMERQKDPTTYHNLPPQVAPKAPPPPNAANEFPRSRSYALNGMNVETNLSAFSPPVPLNINTIKSLIIEQPGFTDSVQIRSVPRIGKPGKHSWFRVKGQENEWPCVNIYKAEGEMGDNNYLVMPSIAELLGPLVSQKRLVTCITLEGDIIFWPLTVSERPNGYNDSALIIAGEARSEWRRMAADVGAKLYRSWKPSVPKPEPVWPDEEELNTLLLKACNGRIIDSMNHPEIIKLF